MSLSIEKAPVAEVVENDKENTLADLTDFTDASQNWINNRIGGANKVIPKDSCTA